MIVRCTLWSQIVLFFAEFAWRPKMQNCNVCGRIKDGWILGGWTIRLNKLTFEGYFFQWLGLLPRNLLCLSCLDMIIMIRFCELKILCVISYNYNRLILVWGFWMTDKKLLTKNKRTFRSSQRQKFVGVVWLFFGHVLCCIKTKIDWRDD